MEKWRKDKEGCKLQKTVYSIEYWVKKGKEKIEILHLTGEETINRQGGTQVILSATLSYDKRAHNGIQIIIYILDLCYNILEGESSPARGEGIV